MPRSRRSAAGSTSSSRSRHPATTSRVAVSTGHAGTLLATAGRNIERLKSEASFAALGGASPIPVTTGRTDRHRLNSGLWLGSSATYMAVFWLCGEVG